MLSVSFRVADIEVGIAAGRRPTRLDSIALSRLPMVRGMDEGSPCASEVEGRPGAGARRLPVPVTAEEA
jgi:hypothetical protein